MRQEIPTGQKTFSEQPLSTKKLDNFFEKWKKNI
jgi:hypothetical protein